VCVNSEVGEGKRKETSLASLGGRKPQRNSRGLISPSAPLREGRDSTKKKEQSAKWRNFAKSAGERGTMKGARRTCGRKAEGRGINVSLRRDQLRLEVGRGGKRRGNWLWSSRNDWTIFLKTPTKKKKKNRGEMRERMEGVTDGQGSGELKFEEGVGGIRGRGMEGGKRNRDWGEGRMDRGGGGGGGRGVVEREGEEGGRDGLGYGVGWEGGKGGAPQGRGKDCFFFAYLCPVLLTRADGSKEGGQLR